MAPSYTFLPLLFLVPFLFSGGAAADVAQGPTPPEATTNLTGILAKGEQYTTLLRLLNSTGVKDQLASQLNNSYDGLTLFAPTDSAFAKLRAARGAPLDALSDQQQVQLVLYHVLPRYYSLATFQTASNPLSTEASGPRGGVYSVNVTASTENSLVNVSTGAGDAVPVGNTLVAEFPLAMYSVDDVLLPEQVFGGGNGGNKARDSEASAPAPAAQAGKATAAGKKGAVPKKSDDVAAAPSSAEGTEDDDETESTNAAAAGGIGSVGWSSVAAWVTLMAVANI